jgi:hypothetical protein
VCTLNSRDGMGGDRLRDTASADRAEGRLRPVTRELPFWSRNGCVLVIEVGQMWDLGPISK